MEDIIDKLRQTPYPERTYVAKNYTLAELIEELEAERAMLDGLRYDDWQA